MNLNKKIPFLFILILLYSCHKKREQKNWSCLADSIEVNNLTAGTDSLFNIGELDKLRHRLDKAFILFDNCPELKKTDSYVLSINNMGAYWIFKEGDYQKGLEYFKLALQTALKEHGEEYTEVPDYYNNIGYVYDAIGNYDSAIYCFKHAISIWHKDSLKNADNIGKGFANLSSVNLKIGNLNESLDYAYKSLKVRRLLYGNIHTEVGEAYCNIGITLLAMNMEIEALDNFKKAESIFSEIPDANPRQLFSVYNSLGNTYGKLRNNAASNTYYQKALLTAKSSEIGDSHPDYAHILSNMANNYLDMGDKRRAIENYEKSLSIYKESMGEKSLDVAITYGQIGKYYYSQGNFTRALENHIAQLNIQRSLNGIYHHEMEYCYRLVSKTYYKLEKFQSAYLYQDSAIIVKDSLQSFDKLNSLAEMKEKYESEINKEEINTLHIKNNLAENKIQNRNRQLFIVVCFSVFIIFLIIIVYRQKRQREVLKHENELYQIELKALRAQLSPHFIFNSLNSIRYYITENTGNIAENYLIRFADLMRNILMQSGQNIIPLAEEIKTVELYLGLEKQRLEDGFAYEISVSGDINLKQTAFPSLILQPFAENAVKHAFSKKGTGSIVIKIHLLNHVLNVSVADNGPGIHKTANDASQGMKLTRSRIENYAALYKVDANFSVSSSSDGTIIEFKIPYKSV